MTDTWGVYCPIPPKPGNSMISHWLTVKGLTNQDAISVFNVCTLLSSSVLRSSMAETPHFISWWGRRKGRLRLRWWWLTPHGNRTGRERERAPYHCQQHKEGFSFSLFFLVPLICSRFPCQNCAFYSWLEWSHSNNLGGPPTTHPWVSYHPNRISAAHSYTSFLSDKKLDPSVFRSKFGEGGIGIWSKTKEIEIPWVYILLRSLT